MKSFILVLALVMSQRSFSSTGLGEDLKVDCPKSVQVGREVSSAVVKDSNIQLEEIEKVEEAKTISK